MSDFDRGLAIVRDCIGKMALDLSGLTVMTEAASGPYLFNSMLCALAGADRVYAITRDSAYATKEEVESATERLARECGASERVSVLHEKNGDVVGSCDIITNSGFVRPINGEMISMMKPTAVVPLMWETWEYRDGDLDLGVCRENGIMVMGTDESKPPLDMYSYCGFMAMKLLFELGCEGCRTRVVLLGGREMGRSIYEHFKSVDVEVQWFSNDGGDSKPYSEFPNYVRKYGSECDAMIVAEHEDNRLLLGKSGMLNYEEMLRMNPSILVGVVAGNIDRDGLKTSGIRYYPREIKPFGYMSYQPYSLGPRPVIELFAAGLKVGEAMARARIAGMSVQDAEESALLNAPAMAF